MGKIVFTWTKEKPKVSFSLFLNFLKLKKTFHPGTGLQKFYKNLVFAEFRVTVKIFHGPAWSSFSQWNFGIVILLYNNLAQHDKCQFFSSTNLSTLMNTHIIFYLILESLELGVPCIGQVVECGVWAAFHLE